MTRTARKAAEAAAESIPPKQLNLFDDPRRSEEATKPLDAALTIIEQRAKEVLAHAKTGLVCEHASDKAHAIARIAELAADMSKVARKLAEIDAAEGKVA